MTRLTTPVGHYASEDQIVVLDVAENPMSRQTSLEHIARQIGTRYEEWTIYSFKTDGTYTYTINADKWRQMWQNTSHIAHIANGRYNNGALWYDGVQWQVDPRGGAIQTAMHAAVAEAQRLIQAEKGMGYVIKLTPALMDILPIAALRKKNATYDSTKPPKDTEDGLVFSDGVRVRILPDGTIERVQVDPTTDIWFGSLPIPSSELIVGDGNAGWRTMVQDKYPNYYEACNACGDDNLAFIATIAGAVVYSTCHDVPALDVLFWAYDTQEGHTGKTRHAKLLFDAFGSVAGAGDWSDIIGKHSHTGDLKDKYLLFCDEAGDGIIRDTAYLKALASGTAPYRPLYTDPQTLTHPVIVMCATNHRPVIAPSVATPPVLRRFVCLEWTQQFPEASPFPCPYHEAIAAIINMGYAVARYLRQALDVGQSAKDALPYRSSIEEMEECVRFVPWVEVLGSITRSDGSVGLRRLRLALIRHLVDMGAIPDIPQDVLDSGDISPRYLKSCPELRSDKAFKDVIMAREIKETCVDINGKKSYNKYRIYVKKKTGDKTIPTTLDDIRVTELSSKQRNAGEGKYVVQGCSLIDDVD